MESFIHVSTRPLIIKEGRFGCWVGVWLKSQINSNYNFSRFKFVSYLLEINHNLVYRKIITDQLVSN